MTIPHIPIKHVQGQRQDAKTVFTKQNDNFHQNIALNPHFLAAIIAKGSLCIRLDKQVVCYSSASICLQLSVKNEM